MRGYGFMDPHAANRARRLQHDKDRINNSMLRLERSLEKAIRDTESPEVLDVIIEVSKSMIEGFRGHEPGVASHYVTIGEMALRKRKVLESGEQPSDTH